MAEVVTDDPFESCCTCCERGYSAGWAAAKADEAKRVLGLVEALVTIETGLVTTESTAKYAGFKPKEIAREALRAYERGDT